MTKRLFAIPVVTVVAGLTVLPGAAEEATPICRNAGNVYKVGEYACIAACHGARRLALCKAASSGATWIYVSDVCPSAHLVAPPPNNASQIPPATAMTPLPGPLKISELSPEISRHLAMLRVGKAAPR